jgi:hypothetical protein
MFGDDGDWGYYPDSAVDFAFKVLYLTVLWGLIALIACGFARFCLWILLH